MTSFARWQVASLMLTVGWALQTVAVGEEFCPHCAQKDVTAHTQKFHDGARGYHKGDVYQKGHAQKGSKSHSWHHKEHSWFYSHHPPAGPIFESVAVRRVPVPQQVNFRIEQESGELRPQPTRAESGAPPSTDIERRLSELEKHVTRLYQSLDKLVDQLHNVDNVEP